MGTYIAKNLNKESKTFNIHGDEIDLKTRQIISPKEDREKGLSPIQSDTLQQKFRRQAEMQAKGIVPETYKDIVKK